ncbi:MAG: ABC transporter permease [Nitrososphaerales archaeon]
MSLQWSLTKNKNRKIPEVVYTFESSLRHPVQLLKQMVRDLWASRGLAWRLTVRDISAQYRQSLLGLVWAFLPPIVMAAGFTLAREAQVINIGSTSLPYPAYVMFSMTLWQTFVEALNGPIHALTNAKGLISRISFPGEALILAQWGGIFFNFAIKLILIVGLFLWFRMPVSWTAVLAPGALILLVVLGTCFGLLLAPLNLLYHDVARGVSVITGFWIFLTPVVYPVPSSGMFRTIVQLNPVTPLLVTTRELATTGVVSDPQLFWMVSIMTGVGLLLAWGMYRIALPFVIERVSA